MTDWETQKEKYLNMPINQKRTLYHCGNDFKTLDTIETWSEYFARQKDRLSQPGVELIKNSVDPALNDRISLWTGDITQLEIDAIVNAANCSLRGGGGVDGAIHRAAGPLLKEECISLEGCRTGDAKITCGYKLPAKYVIHTVGPQGQKPDLLEKCYRNSLSVLLAEKLRTVAFPCISTGIYGYPIKPATKIALKTVRNVLEQNKKNIDRVIFCVFLPQDVAVYESFLPKYFPM